VIKPHPKLTHNQENESIRMILEAAKISVFSRKTKWLTKSMIDKIDSSFHDQTLGDIPSVTIQYLEDCRFKILSTSLKQYILFISQYVL
jgi:hypothetical protein